MSRQKKRLCVWAAVVLLFVLVMGAQSLIPGLKLPGFTELNPGAAVAIFLAALLCEYMDSSLGMGYGTTLTPVLLLAGFEPLHIVPCVLLSEFVTGIAASLMHHRAGNVDFLRDKTARRTAILLSSLSVVGAIAAAALAVNIPKSVLKLFIGIIVSVAGVTVLATAGRQLRYRSRHIVALGTVAAFNKGLSGGGYGPLVTAGQVVSGVSPKQAVAITSLAEGLTCIVGLSAYSLIRGHLELALAAPLVLGAMFSVPVAALTVRRLPEKTMRMAVGVATCSLGAFALIKVLW